MTSIIKVDTIQDQAGNNIINESSNTIKCDLHWSEVHELMKDAMGFVA